MKKIYHRLAALSLAAAALSSCGRSTYSFNPKTPAYLGSQPTVAAPAPRATAPTTVAVVPAAPVAASVATPIAAPVVALAAPHTVASSASPTQPTATVDATSSTLATAPTKTAKPTLVQRLALNSVMKQVAKAQARQQNTAGVTHTAAKSGSLIVAIIGLAALIVGIIASSGFLIWAGAIVLVVGIILLLLKAL